MKRNLFLYLSIIASLTLLANNTQAQKNFKSNSLLGKNLVIGTPESNIITTLESLKELNSKAYKDFTKTVKNFTDLRVTENENGIHLYCLVDGISNRIGYTKRGNWHYTIRSYTEKHLPKDVRHQVKSSYYDFSISGVVEVHFANKIAYVVSLEDETSWKQVKVVDGEMELMGEWIKSK